MQKACLSGAQRCKQAQTRALQANEAIVLLRLHKSGLQITCAAAREMAEDAEDAAMTDAAPATDAYGRLIGEAHTSGRLRGADMLDASEAASSLFALQQVLQRDDAPATTKALRALTNGIRSRDANAKQTLSLIHISEPTRRS